MGSPRHAAGATAAIDGYLLQRSLGPSVEPGPLVDGPVGLVRHHLVSGDAGGDPPRGT
ncbi:hypothetical protein AB0D98_14975 [Streptomyces sp. NPDC047987]|uniref:hypothetical protein n=1 Tax=unclassified Streptomyces TaxID=2593676 RepID=UPI00341B7E11